MQSGDIIQKMGPVVDIWSRKVGVYHMASGLANNLADVIPNWSRAEGLHTIVDTVTAIASGLLAQWAATTPPYVKGFMQFNMLLGAFGVLGNIEIDGYPLTSEALKAFRWGFSTSLYRGCL
jgi:hypothetical protein